MPDPDSRPPPAADDAADIEVLFSTEEIAQRVDSLAQEIAASDSADLLVVSILKGSFIFAADLLRALHGVGLRPEVDFMFLASYGAGTKSRGEVKVLKDISSDVAGRRVLLVDDILESGRTLAFAKASVTERGARRVETCVLLDKPVARAQSVDADYRGFVCPDSFVIGYGMDMAHRYRELPFIGRIRQD